MTAVFNTAPSTGSRPTICLNMIVRNESHIIHEVFDSVVPYISSWVIVDTGSDDGTQDFIRRYMADRGIPGELHERPWRDFGHNRTEALDLAQGHADYIWVIDADDLLMGSPDFNNLDADVYEVLYTQGQAGFSYWRTQLFRDGLPWRYVGVVHEYAHCPQPVVSKRLGGEHNVQSRRLGNRNLDRQKYARDRDLLLAEVERYPNDARSAFYLAQSYFDLGDYRNAAVWYHKRAEMGGWDEEVFMAKLRAANAMEIYGANWPDVQNAYLQAWEFRPVRAEPLYFIAQYYRRTNRPWLGYLFAERAAKIPQPLKDILFVFAQVYYWCSIEEQAICGAWIGKKPEAFALYRQLLARTNVPDDQRQRIAGSRDALIPVMLTTASSYPSELVRSLANSPASTAGTETVTVTITARHTREAAERTLNSFLNCCTDIAQVCRFLLIDAGLPTADRTILLDNYPFLELAGPEYEVGRFKLALEAGWRFFAPEPLITRLTAVFDAEPQVAQVAINYQDAQALPATVPPNADIRRTTSGTRYVLTEQLPSGPAMIDTTRRWDGISGLYATLDELFGIAGG